MHVAQSYLHLAPQVKALEDENLDNVREFLIFRNKISQDEARRMQVEFLRFVALIIDQNDTDVVPSPKVDQFWHAFILHTRQYTDFCNRHLGFYLHHLPSDHWWSSSEIHPATMIVREGGEEETRRRIFDMFPGADGGIWQETYALN